MPQILIVEDETGVRQILSVYAEMMGYESILMDGPTACDMYHNPDGKCSKDGPCVDALLIDQHLDGMTGLEFIQRQRDGGCKLSPEYKAVMAKTFSKEEFRNTLATGCHVLQKPITYEIFEDWLNRMCLDSDQ